MKWYERKYVNRRDWVIDQMEFLGLSAAEFEVVMLVDFFNTHHEKITTEKLAEKTGLSEDTLDQVISLLCAKGYLAIRPKGNSVRFALDGLFETDTARDAKVLDASLFDTFETEFGRPLSQNEMQKITDWNRTYDKKMIIYALREASVYRKLSVNYIDRILTEWKKQGVTAESLTEGR